MANAAAEAPAGAEGKKNKKVLIIILIAVIAIVAGAGGTWYAMKTMGGDSEPPPPVEKPNTFVDLEIFTVNLQPDDSQYLQVGLTVKAKEGEAVAEIKKQMPEIRNRLLMLLSSKKATEISGMTGKQNLSQQIVDEIKQSLGKEELKTDVLEVLFTSFVIQ